MRIRPPRRPGADRRNLSVGGFLNRLSMPLTSMPAYSQWIEGTHGADPPLLKRRQNAAAPSRELINSSMRSRAPSSIVLIGPCALVAWQVMHRPRML